MSRLPLRIAFVVFACALVACAAPAVTLARARATASASAGRAPVIVGVSNAGHMAVVRSALEAAGGVIKKTYRWNAFLVSTPSTTTSVAFSALAKTIGGVQYAQRERTMHALGTANDPGFGLQWGLSDIGAPDAWDVSQGSGVSVAELDSGIDANQPDLAGRVVMDGRFNYVSPGSLPMDDFWHGTHVAGIIAAVRNNNTEGVGTAPLATLYAFKVLTASGDGTDDVIASAIHDVVDKTPCKIITMSFGGSGEDYENGDPVMAEAVSYAQSKGVLLIAAAGNDGASTPEYPAAIPGVIGVGAVDADNGLWQYSNFGPVDEDLVAPGVGILSTLPGSAMQQASGTSMATPFVTGSAALVWSAHPSWNATQVADALEGTAQDLGPSAEYGYGLVRPDLALEPVTTLSGVTPGGWYPSAVTLSLSAFDNVSAVVNSYYTVDGGPQQTYSAPFTIGGDGSHVITYWSVDSSGRTEGANRSVFTIGIPATETLSIRSSSTSVRLRVPFVLSGVLSPSSAGRTVVVMVKKPGSGRWSYSSARLTYGTDGHGGALWWYRYTPIVRGTYRFQATFAGDANGLAAASTIVPVSVR